MSAPTAAATERLSSIAASATLTVAVIHAALTQPHLAKQFYVGVLFAIGTAGLLVAFAGLLSERARPAGYWLSGLIQLGMFAGYLASRTVGLPLGFHEHWNAMGIASVVVEFVFFVCFAAVGMLRSASGPLALPVGAPAR